MVYVAWISSNDVISMHLITGTGISSLATQQSKSRKVLLTLERSLAAVNLIEDVKTSFISVATDNARLLSEQTANNRLDVTMCYFWCLSTSNKANVSNKKECAKLTSKNEILKNSVPTFSRY